MFGFLNGNSPVANVLSALANLSFIIYIPFVLLELRRSNRSELNEQRREIDTKKNEIYNRLIERYTEWQKLCLEYIDLDIADYADERPRELTPVQVKQEQLALGILIELFEQAFLAYLDAPPELRANQWNGWDLYIGDYCLKQNFRKIWNLSRPNMDVRFSAFMDAKLQSARASD